MELTLRMNTRRDARLRAPVRRLSTVALSIAMSVLAGCATPHDDVAARTDIGFVDIGHDITLRRMVVHHPAPKGVVLFLHGFPETLYSWKDIAQALGDDYEVHAFDWPGYGLSSRPPVDRFAYAPRDYAGIVNDYIAKAHIDTSKLVIYATDIGALPALLLALDQPDIARTIVVGDFAPFDRPQYMFPSLQALKTEATAQATHAFMNKTRDEILENAFRRGFSVDEQFEVSAELKDDMAKGWDHGGMTSADAFYFYYSKFTRDQVYFESRVDRLRTPVKLVWGEKDLYTQIGMGVEFADRAKVHLQVLPGIGHYPHLQDPAGTTAEVRASFAK